MAEITCGVIKDLLPLYAEGLTNEESNNLIKQHLSECEYCRQQYEEIENDFCINANCDKSSSDEREAATVDFLKKNNKSRKRWIIFGIVMALALCLSLSDVRHLFAAHPVSAEQVMIEDIIVEEGKIHIDGYLRDSSCSVSSLEFSESDSTVLIYMESRSFNPFAKNNFSADFNTSGEIHTIMLGDHVIWNNGITIPAPISNLFAAKHDFIDEMSKNGMCVSALEMPRDLGPYKNEFQIAEKPYSWTIYLENDMSERNDSILLNALLEFYSTMLIATIGDLDSIQFVYDADGMTHVFKYSEADADLHYGGSVKEAAKTASGLYNLMVHWEY